MATLQEAPSYVAKVFRASAAEYDEALLSLLLARAREEEQAYRRAAERVGLIATQAMAAADFFSRAQTLREAYGVEPRLFQTLTDLPSVRFDEAVEDITSRVPKTIRPELGNAAAQVAELYGSGHVIAFARSASEQATTKVQQIIGAAIRDGLSMTDAVKRIRSASVLKEEAQNWSRAYTETVYRTSLTTAQTNGRFAQARDPRVAALVPAFRFSAMLDEATRPNHRATNGTILSVHDPRWETLAPPLGYNCRCAVVLMSAPTLKRMGRLDSAGTLKPRPPKRGAGPDRGFRSQGRSGMPV